MVLAILVVMLIGVHTETYQEFQKHSNGIKEYRLVKSTPCSTGLRDSGFSIAPAGSVVFKQVNEDGTVSDDICVDKK